jgi:hypothetical protein
MTIPNNGSIQFTSPVAEPSLADVLNQLKTDIFRDFNCHHLATIQSFNPVNQTASASINYTKTFFKLSSNMQTYESYQISYPLMIDMPVIILGGGGANLTFPISSGDQCLILFNDRSIDNWYQSGQVGPLNMPRLHSFSDGIVLVGLRNTITSIANYDTINAKIFNGTSGLKIAPSGQLTLYNETTTLNTILQNIMTQLEALATAVSEPAIASNLAALALILGELLG